MANIKEKIAAVQKGMGALKKDTEAYNYKYVTLDQIQEKMNPLLEKNGLLLTQPMSVSEGRTVLFTRLQTIDDDELIEACMLLPDSIKPQDLGSAISYFRRYSLLSLFNLVTEDDDGAKAQGAKAKKATSTADDLEF